MSYSMSCLLMWLCWNLLIYHMLLLPATFLTCVSAWLYIHCTDIKRGRTKKTGISFTLVYAEV